MSTPWRKSLTFGLVLFLLGLAGFYVNGCGPKPKLPPQDRTPESVLRCAQENYIKFDTFAGLLNLKLKGEDAKFSGTIEFFYKNPDTFSFYPRTFFGIGMFKAKGEDDSLTIYFSKQNEFYSGSFSDFQEAGLWSWEISLEMLLKVILGQAGLADLGVRYTGREMDMFSYAFEDDDWIKDFLVDSRSCRLTQSQCKAKKGGGSYRIEYKNFKTQKQVDVPKIISIRSQNGDYAQIKFLERKFNLALPPEKFEIQIPSDAKRVVFERKRE
jgi:hypothetical protein